MEEGTRFYITYGTTDCFKPPTGMYKRVIFNSQNTVFVMPQYGRNHNYDVGLIRLIEPIVGLPLDRYNGELVNTICLHANQQLDKQESKNFMYVAGFGSKGVGRQYEDSNMTWTYSYRTEAAIIPEYTELFDGFGNNSLLDFYYNDKMYSTCGGDSGGSYAWYINTQDDHVNDVSDYRAVVVSIVMSGYESCDFRYYNDLTSLGIGSDLAVNMRQQETFSFVKSKIADHYAMPEPVESAESLKLDHPQFAYNALSKFFSYFG
ncbi:hypothetical protein HDE_07826 [Halotydeus destructor]|nr:hypothetical protein HDE_07826 [Halotydeus destructor]